MDRVLPFADLPVRIDLTAVFEEHQGWRLVVASHAQWENYRDSRPAHYSGLAAIELAQVIEEEISARLELLYSVHRSSVLVRCADVDNYQGPSQLR